MAQSRFSNHVLGKVSVFEERMRLNRCLLKALWARKMALEAVLCPRWLALGFATFLSISRAFDDRSVASKMARNWLVSIARG